METSAKRFHCFESEKLSLLINNYSTEIPKIQDVQAFCAQKKDKEELPIEVSSSFLITQYHLEHTP